MNNETDAKKFAAKVNLAHELRQRNPDDTAPQPLSTEAEAWGSKRAFEVLSEKAAEYKRLLTALARLQLLKNHVEVCVGSILYTVIIYDEQDMPNQVCDCDAVSLVDACEGALARYDELMRGGE